MGFFTRAILTIQGLYYLGTGLWPILSMHTFELVTGPKVDDWLVRMVALLVIVIGVSLLASLSQREGSPALWTLAIGSALAFAAVDVTYVLQGRIPSIYLADAAAECILILLLALSLRRRQRPRWRSSYR